MTGSDYLDFEKALRTGMKLITTNENKSFGFLVVVGINLGLRIENLLELSYEDLQREKITIVEGKTGKKRTLIINENIKKALSYFDLTLAKGYAFKSQKKSVYSPQHVNRLIKKYFKGKVSSHSLRKTFGRRVWDRDDQSERSLIYLSELYNHASLTTTRIYLGIRQQELDNIYISL